jgi:hypothetical protein
MVWISKKTFLDHMQKDEESFRNADAQFTAITIALKNHDEAQETLHNENKLAVAEVRSTQLDMQATLNDIVKLRPAIEAGIAADKENEYQRKLAAQRRTSAWKMVSAVIATAATVGGLIPLVQWLATIHIHIGVGG